MYRETSIETLTQKWGPMIEAGSKITNRETKKALAQVFENTCKEFEKQGLLTEATAGSVTHNGILGGTPVSKLKDGSSVSKGFLKGNGGRVNHDANPGDMYLPNVIMPMLRRIFPSLIAHELVGVQAMNQPVGFAYAYRAKYGKNGGLGLGQEGANKDGNMGYGKYNDGEGEIGFNPVDTRYTGVPMTEEGLTSLTGEIDAKAGVTVADAWAAYVGSGTQTGNKPWSGIAQDTVKAEYASFGQGTYPTVGFDFIKQVVEARSRKLGAGWSPELAEDLDAMHGFDIESEFVNMISFEIGAEIDRQIVTEMVKAAITGGSVTKWSPKEADGLDQMGRLATLLTQITVEANQIAIKTRRGHANFVVTSPRVTALLEQLSMNKFVNIQNTTKDAPTVPDSGVGALSKIGYINDGQQLLVRDTFAAGDYVLMGYKGAHPADNGIIYCPYIPIQLQKVVDPDTLTYRVGARTRYGIMNSVWDASNYYHFISVKDLTEGYDFNTGRHFLQSVSTVKNGTLFV